MQSRASTPSVRMGQGGGTIVHARRRVGLHGQLRRLPQCAGAHDVELFEPPLGRVKSFLGFPPAASRAQQSNQRSLHGLICGLEQAERPRVGQGLLGQALETGYQRGQKQRAKPSRLLPFPDAPAVKALAVWQIETFEEVTLKRLRSLAQRIGRDIVNAPA